VGAPDTPYCGGTLARQDLVTGAVLWRSSTAKIQSNRLRQCLGLAREGAVPRDSVIRSCNGEAPSTSWRRNTTYAASSSISRRVPCWESRNLNQAITSTNGCRDGLEDTADARRVDGRTLPYTLAVLSPGRAGDGSTTGGGRRISRGRRDMTYIAAMQPLSKRAVSRRVLSHGHQLQPGERRACKLRESGAVVQRRLAWERE
jgi:hypothetical protein